MLRTRIVEVHTQHVQLATAYVYATLRRKVKPYFAVLVSNRRIRHRPFYASGSVAIALLLTANTLTQFSWVPYPMTSLVVPGGRLSPSFDFAFYSRSTAGPEGACYKC